jgi:ribonuclease J
VLSSRFIPGNERAIHSIINHLYKRGAEVLYDGVAPVHVSGHACREELADLIRLVRPRHFVPIHGEYRHLARHIRLAVEAGVGERNCFLLEDGQSLVMGNGEAKRGKSFHAGRLSADGDEWVGRGTISERRALAREGTVLVIVAVSARTGKIVAGPDLVSRGVVEGDGLSPHLERARSLVTDRLRSLNGFADGDQGRLREEMARALRRYFSQMIGKKPLIVPYVMEV